MNALLHALEWFLLPLGLFTVIVSFHWYGRMKGTGHALGDAFSLSFLAKAAASAATTLFAAATLLGWYQSLHPWVVLGLRYVIFISLLASAVFSMRAIRRALND